MIYTDCPNFFHVLDHREEETMTEVHKIDTVETPDKELLSSREHMSSHGGQKLEIHSPREIISTVCDFPYKVIEKCFSKML